MIAIGVDVGGMSIKGGAVDSTGRLFDIFNFDISKNDSAQFILEKLASTILNFIDKHKEYGKIEGIGIGLPGQVDSVNGVIGTCVNLPKWNGIHVKEIMEKLTGYPVRITNDANAAALGEVKFGSGNNCETAIMLTLGTGVGCGIILNGKLFEGNQGKGAELGHSTLLLGGRQCACGRKGCFEAYASASGLIYDTKKAIEEHPESIMKKLAVRYGEVNGKTAFIAAREYEDPFAIDVVNQYIAYLGEGLLNICNIFRPNIIILSGGITNEGNYLINMVNEYIKDRDYGYKGSPEVKVVRGKLGYDSGKIGAAALFF